MVKGYRGFTLIELIITMIILGVLAAFAVPKYFNFREQARYAVMKGYAGSMSSASVANFAAGQMQPRDSSFVTIRKCEDAQQLIIPSMEPIYHVKSISRSDFDRSGATVPSGASHGSHILLYCAVYNDEDTYAKQNVPFIVIGTK